MKNEFEVVGSEIDTLYYSMTKDMINKYDFSKTKDNVEDLIAEYKTAKFEYLVSDSMLEKITSCYNLKYEQNNIKSNDKVGDNISKKIDSKNTMEYFENIFNPLFEMMSSQERKYYSLGLINNNSEQFISDIIGISKTGLQPIKQNCILKIALAFHIAVLK